MLKLIPFNVTVEFLETSRKGEASDVGVSEVQWREMRRRGFVGDYGDMENKVWTVVGVTDRMTTLLLIRMGELPRWVELRHCKVVE